MPALKLKQLQYENDIWKRTLGSMLEENVHLKNRLSEVLKDKFDKNRLEEIEGYQSRFLKKDELIGLLRNEVAELDKLLVEEVFEDGKIIKEIDRKLTKLRKNIINAEKQFGRLKSEFYNYLSEKIQIEWIAVTAKLK